MSLRGYTHKFMLHITHKTENRHKKAFAVEVFMGLMLLSVFSTSFAQASEITADMVIKLTNKAREKAGVAILVRNERLEKAAEKKAEDMLENDYFAHVSPAGKSPWDWIQDSGYDYRYAGENLAINFTDTEKQQEAWMDSPSHRKNILNSDYEEIGVAVVRGVIDGRETNLTVQEFGTKMPKVATTENTIVDDSKNVANVAGLTIAAPKQIQGVQNVSEKIELSKLFQENRPTVIGWYGIFAVIGFVIVIDIAAVFHKKHEQLFILHDARNKHV